TAKARPLFAWPSLVDRHGAALIVNSVHLGDSFISAVLHFDEAEAARPAGLAVGNDLRTRYGAILAEGIAQIVGRGLERQIAHVKIRTHYQPLRSREGPPKQKQKNSLRHKDDGRVKER